MMVCWTVIFYSVYLAASEAAKITQTDHNPPPLPPSLPPPKCVAKKIRVIKVGESFVREPSLGAIV